MIAFFKGLESFFRDTPDKIALLKDYEQNGITYAELDRCSGKVYAWLKKNGIGRDDIVMIYLPRSIRIFVAMIGVWKAGAAFVICESTTGSDRTAYIRKDCACKCFLDEIVWDEMMDCESLDGREVVDPHDLAFVVYTSGSTGNPKGVMHEFGNVDRIVKGRKDEDGKVVIHKECVLAMNSSLNFVAAVDFCSDILFHGATLLLVSTEIVKNPPVLMALYEHAGVTHTFMTPSLFRICGKFNSQMEQVFLGGEPCNGLYSEKPKICTGLNMSESARLLCQFHIDKAYDRTPIGKEAPGVEIQLLGEDGLPVGPGETGEICFENKFMRGYINLPEKTKEAFRGGIFHSGDIASRNADGNIMLHGRKDDMIKINGNRVEPAEIEEAVKEISGLSWCVAKGFTGDSGRAFLCLYYLKGSVIDEADLRKKLGNRLPYYMIPAYFIAIDEIPLLPTGKLNKKALPEPDESGDVETYEAPVTETEKRICAILEKVLGKKCVGRNDDFYKIGGDSIKSMLFMQECADQGFDISVKSIFECRTPAKLAEKADSSLRTEDELWQEELEARKSTPILLSGQRYHAKYQTDYPDSDGAVMRQILLMKKGIDVERLKAAVEHVCDAHPVFRTRLYRDDDGVIRHRYDDSFYTPVEIIRTDRQGFDALVKGNASCRTILDAPLYRNAIYLVEDEVYLFLEMHHILIDGSSVHLLRNQIYESYLDMNCMLPKDCYYSILRKNEAEIGNQNYTKAKEYFESMKADVMPLKPDLPGPDTGTSFCFREIEGVIGERNLAWYIAAAGMAMAKLNRSDSVVVYSIFNGRDEYGKSVSCATYTNNVPVRMNLKESGCVKNLIKSVSDQLEFGNAHTTFDFLLAAGMETALVLSVNYQKNTMEMGAFANLCEKPLFSRYKDHNPKGIFTLNIVTDEKTRKNILFIGYSTGYYTRGTIEKLCDEFAEAMRQIESDSTADQS